MKKKVQKCPELKTSGMQHKHPVIKYIWAYLKNTLSCFMLCGGVLRGVWKRALDKISATSLVHKTAT